MFILVLSKVNVQVCATHNDLPSGAKKFPASLYVGPATRTLTISDRFEPVRVFHCDVLDFLPLPTNADFVFCGVVDKQGMIGRPVYTDLAGAAIEPMAALPDAGCLMQSDVAVPTMLSDIKRKAKRQMNLRHYSSEYIVATAPIVQQLIGGKKPRLRGTFIERGYEVSATEKKAHGVDGEVKFKLDTLFAKVNTRKGTLRLRCEGVMEAREEVAYVLPDGLVPSADS